MTDDTTRAAVEYGQGIYGDGAAILKDGQMMTVDEIVADLAALQAEIAALREAVEQALWHIGTDADRTAITSAGRGWSTSLSEAADQLRAVRALKEPGHG